MNPTYGLKERENSSTVKKQLQFKEPVNFNNSQTFHEYTDVIESPEEFSKSEKAFRCPPSSHRGAMTSSMPGLPKHSLQPMPRQSGRKTNAYSELDKTMSYSILEPHIQDKGFSFKGTGVKQNVNYNVLGY